MEKTMNIYEKIQAVSAMVKNVEKNLTVGYGNSSYKAVADGDVLAKVKEAEQKYRLVSIPVKQEMLNSQIVRTQGSDGREKIMYADVVKMTVRIVNIDKPDEFVEVEALGRGLDNGDKGFGKASTYARKYALLNAYKIATGEDPDQFKSEQQTPATQDEVRTKVLDYLMQNQEYAQQVLSYYNLGSTDDMNNRVINSVYKNLTAKHLI